MFRCSFWFLMPASTKSIFFGMVKTSQNFVTKQQKFHFSYIHTPLGHFTIFFFWFLSSSFHFIRNFYHTAFSPTWRHISNTIACYNNHIQCHTNKINIFSKRWKVYFIYLIEILCIFFLKLFRQTNFLEMFF